MKDYSMDSDETIYEEIVFADQDSACSNSRINTSRIVEALSKHEHHCQDATHQSLNNQFSLCTLDDVCNNDKLDKKLSRTNCIPQSCVTRCLNELVAKRACMNEHGGQTLSSRIASFEDLHNSEAMIENFSANLVTVNRPGSLYRNNSTEKRSSLLRELINGANERTEYAEIVTTVPAMEISLTPSRLTRESENPLLRQEVLPPPTSSSLGSNSKPRDAEGASISDSAVSNDSGIQDDSEILYENADSVAVKFFQGRSIPRSISDSPVYENASRKTMTKTTSLHRVESYYENMDDLASERRCSCPETQIYENMFDQADSSPRGRSYSRPIEIRRNGLQLADKELVYSDLDFGAPNRATHKRVPSASSNSNCSSPVSLSSSLSSLSSNSASASVSPPPPPPVRPASLRRRPYSQSFVNGIGLGLSCYGALYVGAHPIVRVTTEVIDVAIRDVVNRAKMRELRSVFVDVNHNMLRIGSMSQSQDFSTSFMTDHIHIVELYSKDCNVFGIVTSQPRQDGICYVLRSEQALEIVETVRQIFQGKQGKQLMSQRMSCIERPVGLNPEAKNSVRVIKVGAVKVKKSYLVINESIETLLSRTNPREFRTVNFDVECHCLSIMNAETNTVEEQHSVPWILSLGLYNKDSRYFGYIVSEATQGSKTKMYCFVYRCSSVLEAKSILETIRSVCQNINVLSASQMSTSPRYVFSPTQKTPDSTLARTVSKQSLDKQKQESSCPVGKDETEIQETKKPAKPRQRLFTGSLIRRKSSKETQPSFKTYTIDIDDNPDQMTAVAKESEFTVSYLCSTIVNPPLRAKHVRDCFKQYQKEMSKALKYCENSTPANVLTLRVSAKGGVQMVDPRNPNGLKREFAIDTLDRFVVHPENPSCFAFSTVVTGNSKHKCHIFVEVDEATSGIKDSFDDIFRHRIAGTQR